MAAHFLRPGSAFHFADAHPAAYVFDDTAGVDAQGRPGWLVLYSGGKAVVTDDPSDRAGPAARLANARQVNWLHTLGNILGAMRGAGLQLEWLRGQSRRYSNYTTPLRCALISYIGAGRTDALDFGGFHIGDAFWTAQRKV